MTEQEPTRQVSYQSYPQECPHCSRALAHPGELDMNITAQQIYRRHRRKHFDWSGEGEYDPDDDPYLSANTGADEDGLSEECQIDTQTYEVQFTYEVVETVRVEAANKHEAKELASHEQTHRGEYIDTLWTDTIEYGEPSQASVEYLEIFGLLPDDHDVTEDDLQELVADAE